MNPHLVHGRCAGCRTLTLHYVTMLRVYVCDRCSPIRGGVCGEPAPRSDYAPCSVLGPHEWHSWSRTGSSAPASRPVANKDPGGST